MKIRSTFEVPFRDVYYMSHGDAETAQYINGVATFEVVGEKKCPLRYVESNDVWASSPLGAYQVDIDSDEHRKLVRVAVEDDEKVWKSAKKIAKAKKLI
jgi:hypothetical protein